MNRSLSLSAALLLLTACGDSATTDAGPDSGSDASDDASVDAGADLGPADLGVDAGPRDWPFVDAPTSELVEPGVRRELFSVMGLVPEHNPTTMMATPDVYDFSNVLRYREDAATPIAVRSIVVAYPGTFGGAASFDALARALVKRGATSGNHTEVWAIDRRSNLLEDLRGMSTAEAASNAEIAYGYYFGTDTIGGTPFPGFAATGSVSYMSEWTLGVLIEDVRHVMEVIPQAARKGHVFLMGHSAGAGFAETLAAWHIDDDDIYGYEELAGLVLVDGASSATEVSETDYHAGFGTGFMTSPGLDAIRTSMPYESLPILGVGVMPEAEILGMRERYAPTATSVDRQRSTFLSLLFGISTGNLPTMTNRAAFGLALDDESNGIPIFSASLGKPTGGPTTMTTGLFGPLTYPSDPTATYDWIDAPDTTPPEHTPIANLANSWVAGPTNYADWYYPSRLPLDQAAVGPNALTPTSWQYVAGMRATGGPLMDAPVLAVSAAIVAPSDWDAVKARIAPAVGAGRPAAGVTRDDASGLGFRVIDATALTHLDALSAADVAGNPVPAAVAQFLDEHAAADTVTVPRM